MPTRPRGTVDGDGVVTRGKKTKEDQIEKGQIKVHTLSITGRQWAYVPPGGKEPSKAPPKLVNALYDIPAPPQKHDLVAKVNEYLTSRVHVERRFTQCKLTAKIPNTHFKTGSIVENATDMKRLLAAMLSKPEKTVDILLDWTADPPPPTAEPTAVAAASQSQSRNTATAGADDDESAWTDDESSQAKGRKKKRKKTKAQETKELNDKRLDENAEIRDIQAAIFGQHDHCETCTARRREDTRCYIENRDQRYDHLPITMHACWLWAKKVKAGEADIDEPSEDAYQAMLKHSNAPVSRGRSATSASASRAGSPSASARSVSGELRAHRHRSTAATTSADGDTDAGSFSAERAQAQQQQQQKNLGSQWTVWGFNKRAGSGHRRLAARLTVQDEWTTMRLLERVMADKEGREALNLKLQERIVIENWLDEWRNTALDDESEEERAKSLEEAERAWSDFNGPPSAST